MSPRLAFNVLALVAITAHGLAERPALVNDLREPTALAYVEGPPGGFRLLVAESAPPRVIELTLIGQSVISRRTIGAIDQPAVGVVGYEGRVLVATAEGAIALPAGGATKRLGGPEVALTGPPARDERWLFAPSGAELLRARLASGRVMDLRRVAAPVAAAAFSPDGYLVTLAGDESGGWTLAYHNPSEPDVAFASFGVSGLREPIALAIRPNDRTLCALQRDGTVRRLDRTIGEAGQGAAATPIEGPDEVTAIAFAGDGALYVTTEAGELRRLESEL